MKKLNYYDTLKVDQTHLQESFDATEEALWQVVEDLQATGIVMGLEVEEQAPAAMRLNVTAGAARNLEGKRLVLEEVFDLDVSVDDQDNDTAVLSVGNERWISVFARYQPETFDQVEPESLPALDFRSKDGLELFVRVGDEAPTGTAIRPNLVADAALLGEHLLVHGQTDISGDIDLTRRTADIVLGIEAAGGGGGGGGPSIHRIPLLGKVDVDGETASLVGAQFALTGTDYTGQTLTLKAVMSRTGVATSRLELMKLSAGGTTTSIAILSTTTAEPQILNIVLPLGVALNQVTPAEALYELHVLNAGVITDLTHVGSAWLYVD